MRKAWYHNAAVTRQKNAQGQPTLIEVSVPHAYGKVKSVQVRPGDTNSFMADIIEGLLYELEIKETKHAPTSTKKA